MKWEDIIAVSGKPGLYRIIATTKSGVLSESITDKKKTMAPVFQVSALKNIAVFTEEDEIQLPKVIKKMYEAEQSGRQVPAKKASKDQLVTFFREVLPNYDAERFFPSHMKKIAHWYHILKHAEVLDDLIKEEEN